MVIARGVESRDLGHQHPAHPPRPPPAGGPRRQPLPRALLRRAPSANAVCRGGGGWVGRGTHRPHAPLRHRPPFLKLLYRAEGGGASTLFDLAVGAGGPRRPQKDVRDGRAAAMELTRGRRRGERRGRLVRWQRRLWWWRRWRRTPSPKRRRWTAMGGAGACEGTNMRTSTSASKSNPALWGDCGAACAPEGPGLGGASTPPSAPSP